VVGVVPSYYPFVALSLVEGVSASDCFKLPEDSELAFRLLQDDLGRRELSLRIGKFIGPIDWKRFDHQIEAMRAHGVCAVTYRDTEFPRSLTDIPKSPPVLFYKGDIKWTHDRGVAIVGSRSASARGCRFAAALASDLASLGITVTSGLARGIDTASHRGALAGGGATIAVLGTGLDVIYPRHNEALCDAITKKGCVVTEQLMGTPPLRFVFPLRNRLISGLCDMVVVMEAPARSGALITADWALEQGRDVGAVPGFPGDGRSRGSNRLIKRGAAPIETVFDVLKAVRPREALPAELLHRRGAAPRAALSEDERRTLDALDAAPTDPDTLAAHIDRPVATVQRLLLQLEVHGLVASDATGSYYRL
jgi:DNA processing protein